MTCFAHGVREFYSRGKRGPHVVLYIAISVGFPVAINNPVPASQVGFQECRAIERFCVEGSNKCSDRGALQ